MDEKNELLKKVADLEAQVMNLEKDLIHDHLTGLKTRLFLTEESNVYLSAISNVTTTKRKEWFGLKNISFLFIDIDYFKKINDTYGHAVGDTVLKKVSEVIIKNVREGDTVARWGGEEIVVMLLGANEVDAKLKAEEIRKKIEKLRFELNVNLKVTASIGVASAFGGMLCDELVGRADKALYKAKELGRNRVVSYSELMVNEVAEGAHLQI
jgi:diguanylate cyclase (GGDEF)-like protein